MRWDQRNFPRPMRKLPEEVRAKAIEMANILHVEQGFHEGPAVDLAIARAEMWAARYGKENDSAVPTRPATSAHRSRPPMRPHRNRRDRAPSNTRPPLGPPGGPRRSAG